VTRRLSVRQRESRPFRELTPKASGFAQQLLNPHELVNRVLHLRLASDVRERSGHYQKRKKKSASDHGVPLFVQPNVGAQPRRRVDLAAVGCSAVFGGDPVAVLCLPRNRDNAPEDSIEDSTVAPPK